MKTKLLCMSILFLTFAVSCKDDDDDNSNNNNTSQGDLNATDKNFLQMAAYGNYNEVDAGQLAGSKATDTAIKSFGNMMVSDHQLALSDLKTLAQGKSVTLPTGPDPLHVTMKQQLSAMTGRKFDSTYIHMQVLDHQTTVSLFQNEIDNGNNTDVKNYANKYLPHIKMHLNKADTLSNKY